MHAPYTRRIDDATPSTSNVDGMLAVVLVAAAYWVLSQLERPLVFDPRDRDFNPLLVLVGLLAAGGMWYVVAAVRKRAVVRRFGTTAFELDGGAAFVGETLRGRVITSRPLRAADGFRLRLRCIERKGSTFDESRTRTRDAVLWEDTRVVHTADPSAGLPVEFDIPASALDQAKLGAQDWSLKVEAVVDGASYEAVFGLPVYAASEKADVEDDDGDETAEADASAS